MRRRARLARTALRTARDDVAGRVAEAERRALDQGEAPGPGPRSQAARQTPRVECAHGRERRRLGGGRVRGASDPQVEPDVVTGHPLAAENRRSAAARQRPPVDLADARHGVDHVVLVAAQEPGAAVVDDLGAAPCGNASTGVPQASASAMTSPNGSRHRIGFSRAAAPPSRPRGLGQRCLARRARRRARAAGGPARS